ncbi:hypothetical protein MMC25_001141 [Agyrium rufum]|nr:hypothetical protein [Agyrium rufum]
MQEPRKCWICLVDETEDSTTNSPWRTPCPCNLTAHESCLLDWVADLEAPTAQHDSSGGPKKIECPQCKSTITIARPHSYVNKALSTVEHAAGQLIIPGLAGVVIGSIYSSCWAHGAMSMMLIFGVDDSSQILLKNMDWGSPLRFYAIFPSVPFLLIASRTKLLYRYLPIVPPFVVLMNPDILPRTLDQLWPPSPAFAFTTLPYLNYFYNSLYDRLFAEREKAWIAAVRPSTSEENLDELGPRHMHDDLDDLHEGEVALEIEFNMPFGGDDIEIGEDEDRIHFRPAAHPPQPQGHDQANPVNQPDGAPAAAADAQGDNAPPPQAGQDGHQPGPQVDANDIRRRFGGNPIISTTHILRSGLGALAFPAIAAAMGGLLKLTLPRNWTTLIPQASSSGSGKRPGLLQTHWGRSIVGGCMFVILKDTFILYSRYRLAQNHMKRSVVDWDRRKKRTTASANT